MIINNEKFVGSGDEWIGPPTLYCREIQGEGGD